ncbi:MAG TPA: hypothetical protein VMZ27_10695 [Candidatus Saccharimonadales bacterium]|nr:hypothetical protein [Candidatus Saccharimonadales bacterium]
MLLLLSLPGLAARQPLRQSGIAHVAQDKEGTVWGAGTSYSYNQDPVLFRWEKGEWRSTSSIRGLDTKMAPLKMTAGGNGQVICLWWQNTKGYIPENKPTEQIHYTLTLHLGNSNRVLATFTNQLYRPRLFGDSSGNIWITETGPLILQLTPDGKMIPPYKIKPEHLTKLAPRRGVEQWHEVDAIEDARKRVWFWSNQLDGHNGAIAINGLLVFNGGKMDFLEFGPPVENMSIGILANKDASHFWVGMVTNGLYQMDLETFAFTPVKEPAFRAFDAIYRIFSVGPNWYFVNGANAQGSEAQSYGELWRWSNSSSEKLMSGLDRSHEPVRMLGRPYLSTDEGLWLGSGNGGWVLPSSGGAPVPIDWKVGYAFQRVDYLVRLKGGEVFLGAYGATAAQFDSLAKQRATPASPRVKSQIITNGYQLVADSRHHLWYLDQRNSRNRLLKEWDGEHWAEHIVPADLNQHYGQELLPDGRARLWWIGNGGANAKVVIYDSLSTNWATFESFRAALQEAAGKPENLPSGSERLSAPATTPDGRVAYYSTSEERLFYFQGKSWTNWTLAEVKEHFNDYGPITLFFSSEGRLALNQRATTRELGTNGWKNVSYSPPAHIYERLKFNPNAAASEAGFHSYYGITNRELMSLSSDNDGRLWFTSDGQLYRAMPGLCLPQFAADEWHPFNMFNPVQFAVVDSKGRTFFRAQSGSYGDFFVIEPSGPTPQAKIVTKQTAPDSFEATFSSEPKTECWFRWRLNQGSWSKTSTNSTLHLDDLPSGKHVLQVAAINRDLNSAPNPAEVTLVVSQNPSQQIAAQIEKLLSGSSDEREKAVKALARQPGLALDALKAARPKANPDQSWWIEAATQQAEDAGRKSSAKH